MATFCIDCSKVAPSELAFVSTERMILRGIAGWQCGCTRVFCPTLRKVLFKQSQSKKPNALVATQRKASTAYDPRLKKAFQLWHKR